MDEKIEKAIDMLVTQGFRSGGQLKADEALKLSQAALNLAHVKSLLEGKPKKQGT